MSRSTLATIRRACYRTGAILGDVQAAQKAGEHRSARPLFKRAERKAAWRIAARMLRKI